MEAFRGRQKACVIGAGPSGLYVSKLLADSGAKVTVFEKSFDILGNYKYAKENVQSSVGKILYDPRIKFNLCSNESNIGDIFDFYVCATGGISKELDIKGKEHTIQAMDLIKNHFSNKITTDRENSAPKNVDSSSINRRNVMNLGEKVCIIGMGNVAMDLIDYIFEESSATKELTVFSRSELKDAAFDNHKLRGIVESDNWNIRMNDLKLDQNEPSIVKDDRKTVRRYKMLQNSASFNHSNTLKGIIESVFNILPYGSACNAVFNKVKGMVKNLTNKKPKLNLIFNSRTCQIDKCKNGLRLATTVNNTPKEEYFDSIISSIGFISSIPKIKTDKPIFYAGWCSGIPRGNIEDAKVEAEMLVDQISEQKIRKMA